MWCLVEAFNESAYSQTSCCWLRGLGVLDGRTLKRILEVGEKRSKRENYIAKWVCGKWHGKWRAFRTDGAASNEPCHPSDPTH